MKPAALILFAALMFLACFAVDKAVGALRKKAAESVSVRMPLKYPVLTVLLALAFGAVGTYAWVNRSVLFGAAALVFLGVAVYAGETYRSTRIDYDRETFTYRTGREAKTFRFADIDCQRVAINRGGCVLVLVIGSDEAVFYSNMQGFDRFLETAYGSWCRGRGLDPEAQDWHDPRDHRWFPDDEEAA